MTKVEQRIDRLEQEIYYKQAELNELRRQNLAHEVSDYELAGPAGPVRLSELFGDHQDLIVIHNMGSTCPYCTLWADGFNGMLSHFESRAAFVVVSPEPPDRQQEFAESRGWGFRMISDGELKFTEDMGYLREWEGKRGPWPGFSTFHRAADGTLRRIAHASFGPGDPYCGLWHMIDVLEGGVNGWQPKC